MSNPLIRCGVDVVVTQGWKLAVGRVCMHRKKVNMAIVLAGARRRIEDIWLISFMHYELGYIDWSRRPCNPSAIHSVA